MIRFVLLLAVALSLGACRLGPGHVRPEPELPQSWRTTVDGSEEIANTPWWEQYNDPVLNELIERALRDNLDVRIAAARIQEYAARLAVARGGLYPQIGYQADAATNYASVNTPFGAFPGIERTTDDIFAAFTASWEIDVWGRLRSLTEAARADLLSTVEGRRTVIMTLVSTVASSYIGLRGLDRQLEISNQTEASLAETVELFKVKAAGGVISDLEVAQIESEYERAAVRSVAVERQVGTAENAISVLLGSNPTDIPRGLALNDFGVPIVPAGLPSTLLLRRPDIRAAEHDLASAGANVRAARAELYPTISLTAAAGWASQSLTNLLNSASSTWNLAAGAAGPIFTGGRLEGQVNVSRAVQKQLLLTYLQTVQQAFREVEDALIAIRKGRDQLAGQDRRVDRLEEYLRLAQMRYDEGIVSYIEVLDATRRLFDARLIQTQTRAALDRSYVDAYKAMGGGWICLAEAIANDAERGRPDPCLPRCLPPCPSPRPRDCGPVARPACPPTTSFPPPPPPPPMPGDAE